MKAVIIGLGSMGRRRVRILRQYYKDVDIIGIDTLADRRKQAKEEFGIATVSSSEELFYDGDIGDVAAFICTSPLTHSDTIAECLRKGFHVFTEINLVSNGYDKNMELARRNGGVLFLSSTFLYRKEIQYIHEIVRKSNSVLQYIYHAGQYLPDWHPWENYKDFFVGNKATNGCREFMAIEFPWIFEVFGDIQDVQVISSKNSSLDIEYPDTYQIFFIHQGGHHGSIVIDLVSRKPVRNLEIVGEDLYLSWDGTPTGLFLYDYKTKENRNILLYKEINKHSDYNPSVIENAYLSEIENFFAVIEGKEDAKYSFERDRYILSIIDKIEGIRR